MLRKLTILSIVVACTLSSTGVAFAQQPAESGADATPQGLSVCSAHYHFGSVPAVISTSLTNAYQSGTIGFSGTLTNENTYPVVDATVWIKILHKRTGNSLHPDVVDFFPVLEHVTLKANESIPFSSTWKVPPDIEPGDYRAATFVTASDRFALSGLTYSDDVLGNSADFSIKGDTYGALRFNTDSIQVAGQPFTLGEFPVVVPKEVKDIEVTASLTNSTASPVKGEVTWTLYSFDGLTAENRISTKTDGFKIHPNASTTLSYSLTDTSHSVYYLRGEITSAQGAHSSIGVRLVREAIQEPRLTFAGIDGQTAFVCVESTGASTAEKTEVTLTVTSDEWYAPILRFLDLGTVAGASYTGAVPTKPYALEAPIRGAHASYTMQAELSYLGKEVDSVTVSYSCTDLQTTCPSLIQKILTVAVPLLLLVVLILGILSLLRRRRERKAQEALPWKQTHI